MRDFVLFFLLLLTFTERVSVFTHASEVNVDDTGSEVPSDDHAVAESFSSDGHDLQKHQDPESNQTSDATQPAEETPFSRETSEAPTSSGAAAASDSTAVARADSPERKRESPIPEAPTSSARRRSPPSRDSALLTAYEFLMEHMLDPEESPASEQHVAPGEFLKEPMPNSRESTVSAASKESIPLSTTDGSDEEQWTSSCESTSRSSPTPTQRSTDGERKQEEVLSLYEFLQEGLGSSEEEFPESTKGTAQPGSSGGEKAQGRKESPTPFRPRRHPLTPRLKYKKSPSRHVCRWSFSKKLRGKDQAIASLRRAAKEVRHATTTAAGRRPIPSLFDMQQTPDMRVIAALLKSLPESSAPDSSSSPDPSIESRTLSLSSVIYGSSLPVSIGRCVSDNPKQYEVNIKGTKYWLVTVPLNNDAEALNSAVMVERRRARSYRYAARYFRVSGASELVRAYRWNLLLDVLRSTREKQAPVNFPGGLTTANYFVLRRRMALTMKDFLQTAATLEYVHPQSVYVARMSLSKQVVALLSTFTRLGLGFPTISVNDFEVDADGFLYLSTLAPWYPLERAYEVVDAEEGLYIPVDENFKKKEGKELVIFNEQLQSLNLINIILAIWCGDVEGSTAAGGTDLKSREYTARKLLQAGKTEGKCLPESVYNLLSRLVGEPKESRLLLPQATESSQWNTLLQVLKEAVEFYSLTETE